MNKTVLRWLPAAVLPVVVVAAAVAVPAVADASPKLPDKTAQQLLSLVAESAGTAYSGTVEQSSDLGLPDLSALQGGGDSSAESSAMELLTGSHTARVYIGGSDTARVQVMDTLAERDVVRNGSDLWLYSSDDNDATHLTLDATDHSVPDSASTPAEITQQLLDSIDPSTTVTIGDTARVAGRSAYTLTLTPKSDTTLVSSVVLSVDSETGLPLAVSVTADGQDDPAFSVAFSSIDFSAPDASVFSFTPPAGATVTEEQGPTGPSGSASTKGEPSATQPTITGEGWSTIVATPAPSAAASTSTGATSDSTADAASMLGQVTTTVPEGQILQTSLVSVLFATDGRIFVGAVPSAQLQAAANAQ